MLLFVLAVVRSVVWSERLAVIELVVVYIVARLAFTRVTTLRWWRIGTIAPLAAPLLLYVAFTGTEYIRTWDYYRNEYDSVWAFAFERLLTYYATASNNGIGLLVENNNWPLYSGRFVAEWLYLMPELGDWMREQLGDPMTYYTTFLDRFARPEFNSATGLFRGGVRPRLRRFDAVLPGRRCTDRQVVGRLAAPVVVRRVVLSASP